MPSLLTTVLLAHAVFASASPQAVYDDDDPPSGTARAMGRDDAEEELPASRRKRVAALDKGFWGYLRQGSGLSDLGLTAEMQDAKLPLWVAGSILAPVGGFMWVPKIVFRDAPSGGPEKSALGLGALAAVVSWSVVPVLLLTWMAFEIGQFFPPLIIAAIILDAAWVVAFIACNFYVIPRAVLAAYSDA